jgi:hypothetical protein
MSIANELYRLQELENAPSATQTSRFPIQQHASTFHLPAAENNEKRCLFYRVAKLVVDAPLVVAQRTNPIGDVESVEGFAFGGDRRSVIV